LRAKEARIIDEQSDSSAKERAPQIATSVLGIRKRFGKTSVLENITFDVAEGEILVLLGASGSGKTTMLRIIAGLERPEGGRVILHGKDVTDLPARERGVGVIFQAYALFPKMSVEKNISYGLRLRKRPRKEIREAVNRLLSLVQLEEHRKKYPSQLSGGQQQRVAIARTLAYTPEVLLFDEPFGALDTQTRVHLRREIRALLKKVRVPAIFITHDQEEALELGDRIAVLNIGHIEQIGTPQEIYNWPETEYVATFLGAANVLPAVVRSGGVEVGPTLMPAQIDWSRFREGQPVKLVFRPEDVNLSKSDLPPSNAAQLSKGTVEQVSFVGSYERLSVRLELSGTNCGGTSEDPFYLTTETPESQTAKPIVVTRTKTASHGAPMKPGDRVVICLTSFTLLPDSAKNS